MSRGPAVEIRREPADSATARHCLETYYAELAERFSEGFDVALALPTPPDEMTPPLGSFLVAWLDGAPVGCGALKTLAPGVGYLKRMWVAGSVRGLGVGRRLLGALEEEARGLGFRVLRLETNRALQEAQSLYRSAGYREIPPFNDEPYADHWFEKALV
jgi:GNAT superfamily N-acetyltransferase